MLPICRSANRQIKLANIWRIVTINEKKQIGIILKIMQTYKNNRNV